MATKIISCMLMMLFSASAYAGERLPLATDWKMQSAGEIAASGEALAGADADVSGWYPVTVPTTVLAALVANGVYPDPYYGDNLTKVAGYREGRWMVMPADSPFRKSWWFRTTFDAPESFRDEHVTLHFDGINYEANIWLNGKLIADRKQVIGMFRRFEFDVTELCRVGEKNYLAVEIIGPAQGEDKPYRTKQIEATTGWDDHNPQPPDANMGIWEDVYLEATGPVALRHPYVKADLEVPKFDMAHLTVQVQAMNMTDAAVTVDITATIVPSEGPRMETAFFGQEVSLAPREKRWVTFLPTEYEELNLANPKVWWPNPLGKQERYELAVQATIDGDVSDTAQTKFGIRKITTSINEEGWRKYHVNGHDVLIRGGAWMTSDMLLRFDPKRDEALVRYAKEANLNMLRSEGFSIRETNEFYDLCDQYGVMVTQQLFGRSIPDEPLAIACIEDTFLRIRNHPSLVHFLGHDETFPTPTLDQAYRDLIEKHMVDRTYQPHSGAFDAEERTETGGTRTGTRELWTFANPSKYYIGKEDGAWGFAQSGGIGGIVAPYESIKRMLPKEAQWPPTNPTWSLHTVEQGTRYFDTVFKQLEARYGPYDGIETFTTKAMMLNYECARAMFEAYARNKYSATGITTWKYDVAWPAAMTWAYVDWYMNVGGAYYGAKKACEEVHIQYSYDDDSIWVVNSLYQPFENLKATATVYNLDMTKKGEQSAQVNVTSDGKAKAFVLEKPEGLSKTYIVKLTLTDVSGKVVSDNLYWLSTVPEIPGEMNGDWENFALNPKSVPDYTALNSLKQVTVKVDSGFAEEGSETVATTTITNPSDTLAFGVHLAVTKGENGEEVSPTYWEDNYFSLLPGESLKVTARFAKADLAGNAPTIKVGGWNVKAE